LKIIKEYINSPIKQEETHKDNGNVFDHIEVLHFNEDLIKGTKNIAKDGFSHYFDAGFKTQKDQSIHNQHKHI